MSRKNNLKIYSNILIATLLLCFNLAFSPDTLGQSVTVTGQVISSGGSPLSGVSVQEKGTTNGTATAEDGTFSLAVSSSQSVLEFSSLGYKNQEQAVGSQTQMTIVMESSGAEELEQIVVIGYGTAQKRDLTGSIATVSAAEIKDKPASNPLDLLQGRVAGLSVVNSGVPGSEPDVRIRGTNSINGAKPVYIVDGVLNDNINFLSPSDIESMEVLKDPSSLAIFGVRGANGAIVITTKKAKVGQTVVNLNSSIGFKNVQRRMKMTNGDEFRDLFAEQQFNQGVAPADTFRFSPYWLGNTDWQDEIFQKGIVNYNEISINSGTEKNRVYLGIGYTSEQGVIKTEKYKKYTINFNDELRVTKNIKFGVNFNGYRAELPCVGSVAGAIRAFPVSPVKDPGTGLYYSLTPEQRAQIDNPVYSILGREGNLISREFRAVGSIYADIDFLKHFNFRTQLFADYGFNTERSYTPLKIFYTPDRTNESGDHFDTTGRVTSVAQKQNIFPKTQMDYLLTYKNSFGDHNLTALAGVTTYYNKMEETTSSVSQGSAMPIPNNPDKWYVDAVGDPATKVGGGSAWDDASISYLGRILYNYNSKYLLNASFRRDGSSQFYALGNQWKNFGAVGVAWVMSRENFFQNQEFINNLKLKGSWGVLGSKNIPSVYRYPAYPTLSNANSGVFGKEIVSALEPEYIPDPNLTWETVHSWEAGFEADFLNNKFHFEATYYHKKTEDVLTLIPGPSGSRPGLGNLGDIENKGFEFMASYRTSLSPDWDFSVSGNLTTIKNKVLKLNQEGFEIVNGPARTTAGFPIGYFYGYKVIGVYQTQADVDHSPKSEIGTVLPGDLKYEDVDGDGSITVKDRTVIGNPTPDFTYGGTISLTYKKVVDFSVDVQGVYGNEIFRTWNQNSFTSFNYQKGRLERWTGPGTSNWEPIMDISRANNILNSSYWIEDGSYFRIRNIQLGYTFPGHMLQRVGIANLRIYVNAQNIGTFANNTGFTPEIGGSTTAFGIDGGTYPVPAIYTLGFNLNF